MLCPVCEVEMLILELHDVEIDYCHECEGIWLDEGELELVVTSLRDTACPISQALVHVEGNQRGNRRCPVCRKKMVRVDIPTEPVVEIDKCPWNHGLWFDQGELEQVNNAAGEVEVVNFIDQIFNS